MATGIRTFGDLVTGNFLYVDKTRRVYELLRPQKGLYLPSRLRRFGKSLLLSTLKAIFQRQREIFDGLAFAESDYDWPVHPVIHIDMSGSPISSREGLSACLDIQMKLIAETGLPREQLFVKIRHRYNGYRFSKRDVKVYNPVSTMLMLKRRDFSCYWFGTGPPTFLLDVMVERDYDVRDVEQLTVDELAFSAFDPDDLRVEPLLFQTGYLTILVGVEFSPEERNIGEWLTETLKS